MDLNSIIHQIGEFTSEAILIADADAGDGAVLTIRWVNPAFCDMTRYALDDVYGQTMGMLAGARTDKHRHNEIIDRLMAWEHFSVDIYCHRKDATGFWGHFSFQPLKDDEGRYRFWISLIRDVTLRKEAEERNRDLAMISERTQDMVTVHDADREIIWVNPSFTNFTGYTPEEARGHRLGPLLRAKTGDEAEDAKVHDVVARLDRAEPVQAELLSRRKDGSIFLGQYEMQPVFDEGSNLIRYVSLIRDITERRTLELRYKAVFDESSAAISIKRDGRYLMVNRSFADALGRDTDWFRGRLAADVLAPAVHEEMHRVEEEVLRTGRSISWERRGQLLDGAPGNFLTKNFIVFDPVLNSQLVCTVDTDITEIRRTEEKLRETQKQAERAEGRLLAAINALSDSFVLYDSDERVALANRVSLEGSSGDGTGIRTGDRYEDILREGARRGMFAEARGREEEWIAERMASFRTPGMAYEQELSDGRIFRFVDRKTENADTVSLRIDITQLRQQQRQLETYAAELKRSQRALELQNQELIEISEQLDYASRHDSLTGLPNRRYLDSELRKRAALARAENEALAVLHIDLDRFKQINDALGHAAGDFVLQKVAEILHGETRDGDFAARVGGDEFVIVSRIGRGEAQLGRFASRIIRKLSEPARFEGQDCRYGASIGIAMDASGASDPEQLLINADIALYRAKSNGRNRWAMFSKDLQAEVLTAKGISDDVLRGLDRDEFFALYQPQFSLRDMSLAGAEVLLRWAHPEKGLLEPSRFIRQAEDLNVLAQIDQIILRKAVKDDALWRASGGMVPRLALNVSGRRLRDPELIEDIKTCGIDPRRLSVELLESIFLDDDEEVLAWAIDHLKEMGVGVELDDFGTGHSSIVGLIRLKPDRIKIDRQFIEQAMATTEYLDVIRSVAQIGHSLGVEVLAEGVENVVQGDVLRSVGCDMVQGYAYAPPMTADEFRTFLQDPVPRNLRRGR